MSIYKRFMRFTWCNKIIRIFIINLTELHYQTVNNIMWSNVIIANVFIASLCSVKAALSPSGKRCGTTVCNILDYCSTLHNQCESCVAVCDDLSHNYDQDICIKDCQSKYFKSLIGVYYVWTFEINQELDICRHFIYVYLVDTWLMKKVFD